MAKVYKVSFYATDYNEDYHNGEDLKDNIQYHLDSRLWVAVDHLEVEESEEFEWDDELAINKTSAVKEDFEAYFEKKD